MSEARNPGPPVRGHVRTGPIPVSSAISRLVSNAFRLKLIPYARRILPVGLSFSLQCVRKFPDTLSFECIADPPIPKRRA